MGAAIDEDGTVVAVAHQYVTEDGVLVAVDEAAYFAETGNLLPLPGVSE